MLHWPSATVTVEADEDDNQASADLADDDEEMAANGEVAVRSSTGRCFFTVGGGRGSIL